MGWQVVPRAEMWDLQRVAMKACAWAGTKVALSDATKVYKLA